MEQMHYSGFFQFNKFALAGISRSATKFGNTLFFSLIKAGKNVYPIHPEITTHNGYRVYPSLPALPEKPEVLVICTKPAAALQLIKEAQVAGINNIWLQQGSESPEAVQFCKEAGMQYAVGKCALMYLEPVTSVHKFHRWVARLTGSYSN